MKLRCFRALAVCTSSGRTHAEVKAKARLYRISSISTDPSSARQCRHNRNDCDCFTRWQSLLHFGPCLSVRFPRVICYTYVPPVCLHCGDCCDYRSSAKKQLGLTTTGATSDCKNCQRASDRGKMDAIALRQQYRFVGHIARKSKKSDKAPIAALIRCADAQWERTIVALN